MATLMEQSSAQPLPATMATPATTAPEPNEPKLSIEQAAAPSATALTPPTSEEMNHEVKIEEDEESELSELDLDDEEDEEIEPDHYWDGGKIPVFKPTMDQFRSFKKFMEKVDKYGMKSGIVKVIPPKEWRDSLPALDEHVKRIKIKNPITQEFNGTFGTYTQQNVEKQRSYNLPEWKALNEEPQHQPPAKRGERRKNQEKASRSSGSVRARAPPAPKAEKSDEPASKRKPGRPARNSRATATPTPDSPATTAADAKKPAKARSRSTKNGGSGQAKSVTSRRLNNTAESTDHVDEAAFENFDYRMDGLDEFTPERCAELETHYWKSLAFNQPMYGADMPGSLFDETCTSWNVAKLENLLDVLGTKVPGVNTAYLYMGMWKATFAWHLEDVDLYSINYIHFGAPKQWYSISQEDARKFEAAMKNNWPMDAKHCDQFLRHKTYLISPDVLQKQYNVKVNKLVHYEGEFVITYPYGYHSGYNIGYNCAESVNFALESWLEYGRIARKCNCESDNVWVDVAEIERKLRGEPTPEYYEETDDDDLSGEEDGNLPSPPQSVKGKAQRSRKRKLDVKDEKTNKKRKIRIKIKGPTREPCAMCPNDNPWEPLLPTDNGKQAHLSCASYTPETWIDKDDNGNERICGVGSIDRARLELKCNLCRSKRGACFQCSSKKCTRAFHATCALAAGVQVDAGMVPTFGEDGTEYMEMGYDFRCRYHRPKMPKNVSVDMLENSKRINQFAKDVKPNEVIQAQYIGGEVFAGLVIENRPGEMSLLVDVLPDGERVEVEYKWLCVLNPDDSQRPQPSQKAILMPEGMNRKQVSVNNRQDGVPSQGETFSDNTEYKFQEFYNMHMPPPTFARVEFQAPMKLKVDMDARDQLFYYIPTISTDTKPFFTVKVGSTEVSPAANFIERMNPRPAIQQAAPRIPMTGGLTKFGVPPAMVAQQGVLSLPGNMDNRYQRPYVYKPRETPQPSGQADTAWIIDPQALATQRKFLAEAGRCASGSMQPQTARPNGGEQLRPAAPVRSFPREHYYSTATLPAAFPGEYSGFVNEVRRQSHGHHAMPRPDFEQLMAHPNQMAPGGGPMDYHRHSSTSRPTSSAHSHPSPLVPPLTPATTASTSSKCIETSAGYLENLKQYPYLLNSYLRKVTSYESPYTPEGGFSAPYQPMSLGGPSEPERSKQTHSVSVSSIHDTSWTPPSLRAHDSLQSPFIQQSQPLLQQPMQQPMQYRSPYGAQPPLMSSTASRDGAQARMIRDQHPGHGYYTHNYTQQGVDVTRMFQSPKGPTPSPLSDSTPAQNRHLHMNTSAHHWDFLPRGPENGHQTHPQPPSYA
ncbi:Hypothetical protein R9X50_00714000 [Acrodontium crateriforme]|uniref:[histone H3]-trimethyl-L-lysine(9) demethylase n=1 Tax=Acrodontium crateriforme TaxID=150365 RepID=A0AAQ3R7C8_9PEZI|nr:Hypothetical protein R9X50_00714000 [Acrodontium crateriforme]